MAWFSRNSPCGRFRNETIAKPLQTMPRKKSSLKQTEFNMRKITLLFIITLLTFSCSSDDDNGTEQNTTDPIVAKWQFGKVVYLYNDGTENTIQPDMCDLQSNYNFIANNTIELTSYIEDNNGGCEFEITNFEYFNWTKIENGKYRITVKNVGEAEEVDIENVTFEGNEMIWKDPEGGFDGTEFYPVHNYFTKIN